MKVKINDKAPNFKARTTEGPIDLYEWMGNNWVFLFSHPADFTPVCTTELGQVARMKQQFDKRNVKVIGLSVDDLDDHKRWLRDIEATQDVKLNFPVIADPDRTIADKYGLIEGNGEVMATGRAALIIDPDKKIRLSINYPESTGRNFNEVLRVIDSLQLFTEHEVATPANWVPGDDIILSPSISEPDAKRLYPDGYTEHTDYLRMASVPAR